MNTRPGGIQELVRDQWADALKKVLASMTQETFEITVEGKTNPRGASQQDESWSWYSSLLSISPASTIWAGAADESWTTLGKALLTTMGVEETTPEDMRSVCTDIFAQSNGALAQGLTERFGSEITCGDVVPSKPPDGGETIALSIVAATLPGPVSITVSFDESIFKELSRLSQSEPAGLASRSKVPSSVSELRLNLYATLGKAELSLDSILKFNVGSVIDIGRSVTDFVDVVANGKVIARGQVVAFRGNYAIKCVSTKSKTTTNPAVFHGNSEFGDVEPAATDGSQSGLNTGGYDV